MDEDTKCVHCEVLTRQRDSVQKDVDYLTGLLERVRIDRNKALVRVTELVAELNEFRTADDDYNADAKHYAKKCAELRKELEQCKTPESPEAEAERERKAIIADRLGVPPGGFLGPHVMLALDELDHLRCKLAMAMQAVKNLEIACEQSEDELKALRATTSGGEVYVTGNGQPFTIIKDGVPLVPASITSVDAPADQVEALAWVLRAAYMKECHVEPSDCPPNKGYLAEARAAIAHLNTRPEGLPTVDGIAKLIWDYDGPHGCEYDPRTCEHTRKAAEIVYTALRPWLRNPVGCELDVTAEEAREAWGKAYGHPEGVQAVLDLCRSRIRPAYECNECAARAEADRVLGLYRATRAALEGE